MNVKFDNIYFLYFFPVLLILMVFMWHKGKDITILKKILPIRLLTLFLVFVSLLNPWITMESAETQTIFLVDRSESSKGSKGEYTQFIKESLEYMEDIDTYSIISFGGNTVMEKTFQSNNRSINLQGIVEATSTDIPGAVKKAYGLFEDEKNKRIVILSDGKNNGSNKEILVPEDLEIIIKKTEEFIGPEVQISSVDLPEKVDIKEKFDIEIVVDSNMEMKSELVLYDGKSPLYSRTIYLKKGSNRFIFEDSVESSGLIEYKAEITPEKDTLIQNNVIGKIIEVEGSPNILLISSKDDEILSEIIIDSGVILNRVSIDNLNPSIDYLSKYDGIIVNDISKWRMSQEFMTSMVSYVKDLGRAVFVVGGKESFSIGGYLDTTFEKILPVRSEAIRESQENSMDMVIVIDKSGSMMGGGSSNIFLAKQAAAKVYRGLKPSDRLGIVVFDTEGYDVLPMGEKFDEEEVMMKIGGINASGGTNILVGLEKAYESLDDSVAKSKHIILVTDGQSSKDGIAEIVSKAEANDISISSIAIGDGSDKKLLKNISDSGHGRYYFLKDASSIPEVFLKESEIMSKSYLNDRKIYPKVYYNTPQIGFNIDRPIYGYISTSLKSSAELILESDRNEPVLAYWKYGLGDAFALTTDLSGNWSREILESPEIMAGISEIVKYLGEDKYSDSFQITFKQSNENGGEIWVKDSHQNNNNELFYSIQGEDIKGELKYVGDKKWKGNVDSLGQGIHYLKVEDEDGNMMIKAFEVNYPKEYNVLLNGDNINNIQEIAKPSQVFLEIDKKNTKKRELRNILLIIAIVLFLIDIFIRTTSKASGVVKEKITVTKDRKNSKIINKEVKKEVVSEKSTSSRLLDAKKKINK